MTGQEKNFKSTLPSQLLWCVEINKVYYSRYIAICKLEGQSIL